MIAPKYDDVWSFQKGFIKTKLNDKNDKAIVIKK